jgi:hypothetical protein
MANWLRIVLILTAALALLAATACSGGNMVLEREYAGAFRVVDRRSISGAVTISGYSAHSLLNVKDCQVTTFDRTAIVRVYLVPHKTATQGNFSVDVPVGSKIDRIVFGDKRRVVWRRGCGAECAEGQD